jgi:hypothetical protein
MSDVTEVLQQRLDADVLSGDVPEEFQVCYLDADVLSGDVPEEFQVCYLDADVLSGDVLEEFQVCYLDARTDNIMAKGKRIKGQTTI